MLQAEKSLLHIVEKGLDDAKLAMAVADFNDFNEFADRFMKKLAERREDYLSAVGAVFEKYYDEEQMASLITFYQAPVGARIIASQPQVQIEAQTMGAKLGNEIGMEVLKELEAEGKF